MLPVIVAAWALDRGQVAGSGERAVAAAVWIAFAAWWGAPVRADRRVWQQLSFGVLWLLPLSLSVWAISAELSGPVLEILVAFGPASGWIASTETGEFSDLAQWHPLLVTGAAAIAVHATCRRGT